MIFMLSRSNFIQSIKNQEVTMKTVVEILELVFFFGMPVLLAALCVIMILRLL